MKLSLPLFETNCPLVNTLNTFELIFIYIADYLGLTIDLVTQSLTLCALVQAPGKAAVTAIEHTRKQTTVYFITDRKTAAQIFELTTDQKSKKKRKKQAGKLQLGVLDWDIPATQINKRIFQMYKFLLHTLGS